MSVKTEGLDAYYPHMIYYYDSGEWTFEQDVNSTWNEQYVSIDREYFFRCNIALNNGYDWNEEMQGVDGTKKVGDMKTFSVYVNGKLCKDATITYYGAETDSAPTSMITSPTITVRMIIPVQRIMIPREQKLVAMSMDIARSAIIMHMNITQR